MTLRRPTKNTTVVFRRFNLIQWIISTTGWLKSWPVAIQTRLVRIRIALRFCATSLNNAMREAGCFDFGTSSIPALSLPLVLLVMSVVFPAHAQTRRKSAKKNSTKTSAVAPRKKTTLSGKNGAMIVPAAAPGEKRLAQLARALRDHPDSTTYAAFSAYASNNAKNEIGARAALALGYYDLTRDKPDLALGWLRKATDDKDLRGYAQYWQAQALITLGQKEEGFDQLQNFRRDFPDSVMTEQAVTSLVQTALAIGKTENALAALSAYPNTSAKPALLLLRAQAREKAAASKAENLLPAAVDYLDLYYRFPLSDEAKVAGQRMASLQSALGAKFPGGPLQTQLARAESFYLAKHWHDARPEYAGLLPKLS